MPQKIKTEISGLDKILKGGLIKNRSYMVRGGPGAGKTLLGIHYLSSNNDKSLYINLGEPIEDIKQNAENFGFDLQNIEFLDLSPDDQQFTENQQYEIFHPSEVEKQPVNNDITNRIEDFDPDRVFIDPLTQLRYLSKDQYQFRKQVLSLLRYLKQNSTILFTSQDTKATPDDDLQFMSDGIIHIDHNEQTRQIKITKYRGSNFQGGTHSVKITDKGMTVYPELQSKKHNKKFNIKNLSSGVPEIDELLGNGIHSGTNTIISGPSGVGKTTLGGQFMKEAAGRGERSVIYLFEESEKTFLHRSQSINIPVKQMIENNNLSLEEVEPLDLSPQEFSDKIRIQIEEKNTDILMIDGVEGYKRSIQGGDDELVRRLHSIGRYIKNMGKTGILINQTKSVTGDFHPTGENISYLADNIIFLRYLELQGKLEKAIGVLKKRTGDFERSLRKFEITQHGLKIGEPLKELRGILQGTPQQTKKEKNEK